MGLAKTTRLIQLEEGRKLTAYKDPRGIWTIGDGYNLEAHGYSAEECEGLVWTTEQADAALADEIQAVLAELDRRWPKWRDLDEVRQAAIVSSVYQLGAPGASKFFATIHAIQSRDWETAATQMLASRWAKQTPARVKRNAEMIRTGQWPEEVNGVRFLTDPPPAQVVAPAPAEPAAPRMPVDRLPDMPGDGTTMGDAVRADLPDVARLTVILKALAKSKTIYGVLGMLGLQLLGVNAWDVAIRIGGQIYTVPDLSPYLSTILASLAVWGRMTAKPIGARNV
ncbi:glycoside hydrolase family protein [Solidesulfovibrio sp.]|uniref:glycoside hydrolase family protein n=1 Tax=Solidesulfovibrio sp. TaxID=2910990 RepID=UPI002627FA09|nr:glycoside hydrolase family protein [Solidesulfovibrio sp.]